MQNGQDYPSRKTKFKDRSNFGLQDEPRGAGPQNENSTATRRKLSVDTDNQIGGGSENRQEPLYTSPSQPELEFSEQVYGHEPEAASIGYDNGYRAPSEPQNYIYGQDTHAEEMISESYDPADYVDYDEFGRRRKKRYSETGDTTRMKRIKAHRRGREVVSWILSIGLAIAAALLIRAFVFEIILVDGESMYPTLYTDERVAIEKVTRYSRMPERGEIIIVEYPQMEGTYVKRAIGLPGETVEVKDSIVYIDGVPLQEDYINKEDPYADMAPVLVDDDYVFVMGDNRAHSLDSRTSYIGPIAQDAIIGHALFVIWPLDNIHTIE